MADERTWDSVVDDPRFQQLDDTQKAEAKKAYFREVVIPKLPADKAAQRAAWNEFSAYLPDHQHHDPSIWDRVKQGVTMFTQEQSARRAQEMRDAVNSGAFPDDAQSRAAIAQQEAIAAEASQKLGRAGRSQLERDVASADGLLETAGVLAANPLDVMRDYALPSLVAMAPEAARDMLLTRGVGTLAGGVGRVARGVGAALTANRAYNLEQNAELFGELQRRGIDTSDPDALAAAFADPELMSDVRSVAMRKAVPVAAAAGLSAGLAGAKLRPTELGNAAVQAPVRAAIDMAGEAASQQLARGNIDGKDVLIEGAAGAVSTPVEIAGAALEGARTRPPLVDDVAPAPADDVSMAEPPADDVSMAEPPAASTLPVRAEPPPPPGDIAGDAPIIDGQFTDTTGARIAELERHLAAAKAPQVKSALRQSINRLRKTQDENVAVAEFRTLAQQTQDPELKRRYMAAADAILAKRPTGPVTQEAPTTAPAAPPVDDVQDAEFMDARGRLTGPPTQRALPAPAVSPLTQRMQERREALPPPAPSPTPPQGPANDPEISAPQVAPASDGRASDRALGSARDPQADRARAAGPGSGDAGAAVAGAGTPAPLGDSQPKSAPSLKETGRRKNADGSSSVSYQFADGRGTADVRIGADNTAYITDVQIGDAQSNDRGKGVGTKAYEDIAERLRQQGIKLKSTRWSENGSAISPAALRVWEKLEQKGLALRTGSEMGKVVDRFTGLDEAREIPTYEYTGQRQDQQTVQAERADGATRIAQEGMSLLHGSPRAASPSKPAVTTNAPEQVQRTGPDANATDVQTPAATPVAPGQAPETIAQAPQPEVTPNEEAQQAPEVPEGQAVPQGAAQPQAAAVQGQVGSDGSGNRQTLTAGIRTRAQASPPGLSKTLTLLADAIDARDTATLDRIVGNVENKLSRGAFTEATGVKLPRTVEGTRDAVRQWAAQPAQTAPPAPKAPPAVSPLTQGMQARKAEKQRTAPTKPAATAKAATVAPAEQAAPAAPTPNPKTAALRERAKDAPKRLRESFIALADGIDTKNVDAVLEIVSDTSRKIPREAFTEATGVRLPRTHEGTRKAVLAWADTVAAREQTKQERAQRAADSSGRRGKRELTSADIAERSRLSLLQLVRRLGGVTLRERSDITGERGVLAARAAPGLFRHDGNELDWIATNLHEAGFLSDADMETVDGGVERVRELLQAAIRKQPVLSVDYLEEYTRLRHRDMSDAAVDDDAERAAAALGIAPDVFDAIDAEALRSDDIADLLDFDLLHRIARADESAFEHAARRFENDDAGMMQWAQDWINERAEQAAEADRSREGGHGETQARGSAADRGVGADGGEAAPEEAERPGVGYDDDTDTRPPAQEVRQQGGLFGPQPEVPPVDAERARRAELTQRQRSAAPAPEGFTLTGSDRDADVAMARGQQPLFAGYGTDDARASAKHDVPRDVQPATPLPRYESRADLVETGTVRIGVPRVRTAQDLADATSDIAVNAVERLQAIVTDASGKVLAVVGGFKGTINASAVYARTIVGEVMGIDGAAHVWLSHNHPSGVAVLSAADKALSRSIDAAFGGTRVKTHGIMAVGAGPAEARSWEFSDGSKGVTAGGEGVKAPVMERMYTKTGKLGAPIESPQQAAPIVMGIAGPTPGIVFMDAQHAPLAFVPWSAERAAKLRDTGALDDLYTAAATANAATAIIANPDGAYTLAQIRNLAAGLAVGGMEIRVLDAINYRTDGSTPPKSMADSGVPFVAGAYFSLSDGAPAASTAPQLREALAAKFGATGIGKLIDSGLLRIVQSHSELPAHVRAAVERAGPARAPRAIYFRGNDKHPAQAFIVADRVSAAEAPGILLHEIGEHHGLADMLGKEGYAQLLDDVRKGRDSDAAIRAAWAQVARLYGHLTEGSDAFVREVIAHVGERADALEIGWFRGLVNRVRQFLRKLGLVNVSASDIRKMVSDSLRRVMDDAPVSMYRGDGVDFAAAADQTESPAFRRWFGDSVVTHNGKPMSEGGRPLVVYHGTAVDFDAFDAGAPGVHIKMPGIYFSPNPVNAEQFATNHARSLASKADPLFDPFEPHGERIVPAYLALQNPADIDAGGRLLSEKVIITALKDALRRGNDGAVIRNWPDGSGPVQYVAFRPEQIKSAVGNRGTFDPSDPRIDFSLADDDANAEDAAFERAQSAGRSSRTATVASRIKTHGRRAQMAFLNLRNLAESYGHLSPSDAVNRYVNVVAAMRAETATRMDGVGRTLRHWRELSKSESDAVSKLMHDATIAGVRPQNAMEEATARLRDKLHQVERNYDGIKRYNENPANTPSAAQLQREGRLAEQRMKLRTQLHNAERNHSVLARRYAALSDAAREVYDAVEQSYKDAARETRQAQLDRIDRMQTYDRKAKEYKPVSEATKQKLRDAVNQLHDAALVIEPYFPLKRFGDYVVRVVPPEGKEPTGTEPVQFVESEQQARDLQEALRAEGIESQWFLRADDQSRIRQVAPEFLQDALDAVAEIKGISDAARAAALDDIYQAYYRALPDISAMKQLMHRKGVLGYDPNAMRSFAFTQRAAARRIARLGHVDQLEQATAELASEARQIQDGQQTARGQLRDALSRHLLYLQNPPYSRVTRFVGQLGFVYFMAFSISNAMLNATQVPVMTFPRLAAKFGTLEATKALRQAYATVLAASPSGSDRLLRAAMSGRAGRTADALMEGADVASRLEGDERAAYERAVREGVITVTLAHDIMDVANDDVSHPAAHLVSTLAAYPQHATEKLNREVTLLAAYRLARRHGSGTRTAYAYAVKMVEDTQFDYSSEMRAEAMRGSFARAITQFKSYGFQTLYRMARDTRIAIDRSGQFTPEQRREAGRTLVGAVVVNGLATGLAGTIGYGALLGLASAITNLFRPDDDEIDLEREVEEGVERYARLIAGESFGGFIGDSITHGMLPRGAAARLGMGTLIWRDVDLPAGGDANSWYATLVQSVLGVPAGLAMRATRAARDLSLGNDERAFEALLPKAFSDPLKATRIATEGFRSRDGSAEIEDPDARAMEIFAQAIGFAPSRKVEADAERTRQYLKASKLQAVRGRLVREAVRAWEQGDTDALNRVYAEIDAYNDRHPKSRIATRDLRNARRRIARKSEHIERGEYVSDRYLEEAE